MRQKSGHLYNNNAHYAANSLNFHFSLEIYRPKVLVKFLSLAEPIPAFYILSSFLEVMDPGQPEILPDPDIFAFSDEEEDPPDNAEDFETPPPRPFLTIGKVLDELPKIKSGKSRLSESALWFLVYYQIFFQ